MKRVILSRLRITCESTLFRNTAVCGQRVTYVQHLMYGFSSQSKQNNWNDIVSWFPDKPNNRHSIVRGKNFLLVGFVCSLTSYISLFFTLQDNFRQGHWFRTVLVFPSLRTMDDIILNITSSMTITLINYFWTRNKIQDPNEALVRMLPHQTV